MLTVFLGEFLLLEKNMAEDDVTKPMMVEFVYPKRVRNGAVMLCGEWNDYEGIELLREMDGSGSSLCSVQVELDAGVYRYFFLVNGKRRLSERHAVVEYEGTRFNERVVHSRYSLELQKAEISQAYEKMAMRRLKYEKATCGGKNFTGVEAKKELSPVWFHEKEKRMRKSGKHAPLGKERVENQRYVSNLQDRIYVFRTVVSPTRAGCSVRLFSSNPTLT